MLSSVAVAIAPGTPGIGNVRTGCPVSHESVVAAPAPAGRGHRATWPGSARTSRRAGDPLPPRSPPWVRLADWPRYESIVPASAAGVGVALPLPATISAPGMSSFQAYLTAHRFDGRVLLAVGLRALDLRALSWRLVVGADAVLRQRAGLTVHLDRAFALVFERGHDLRFASRLAACPCATSSGRARPSDPWHRVRAYRPSVVGQTARRPARRS